MSRGSKHSFEGLKFVVEICDEDDRKRREIHESLCCSILWPTSTGQEPKGPHFLIHFFPFRNEDI